MWRRFDYRYQGLLDHTVSCITVAVAGRQIGQTFTRPEAAAGTARITVDAHQRAAKLYAAPSRVIPVEPSGESPAMPLKLKVGRPTAAESLLGRRAERPSRPAWSTPRHVPTAAPRPSRRRCIGFFFQAASRHVGELLAGFGGTESRERRASARRQTYAAVPRPATRYDLSARPSGRRHRWLRRRDPGPERQRSDERRVQVRCGAARELRRETSGHRCPTQSATAIADSSFSQTTPARPRRCSLKGRGLDREASVQAVHLGTQRTCASRQSETFSVIAIDGCGQS